MAMWVPLLNLYGSCWRLQEEEAARVMELQAEHARAAQAAARAWQRAVEAMDAKGLPPPPPPANLPKPPRLAQDVALPPVSFPIAAPEP